MIGIQTKERIVITRQLGVLLWAGACLALVGCSSESPAIGDGGAADRASGERTITGDGPAAGADGPAGAGDGPAGAGDAPTGADGPAGKVDGPASKKDGKPPTADSKPAPDTGPPLCGPTFAVSFSALQEQTLHTASGTVSYDGTSPLDPLSSNKRGALATNSCGEAGLLYRAVTGSACELVYARFTKAGLQEKSAVLTGASSSLCPTDAALFYDAGCAPQVMVRKSATELSRYALDAQKKWQATTVTLAPLSGHTLSSILTLTRGRDGKMHLLLRGYQSGTGGGERILHGTLSGASWSFAALPAIAFTSVHEHHSTFPYNVLFHFAVDSKGAVHAVFNNDAELGYAVSSGNAWKQEIVVTQADNRSNGGFDASLALDANDQPLIAGSSSTHYVGWSIKSLKLQLHSRGAGGSWSSELIADTADGYVGGDGNKYTGPEVQLQLSSLGHPYVVFSDLASWHITYNYRSPGQIRYATKACGKWHHYTPFKQKGQTVSPNPIYSCRNPMGALLSDGQSLLFACMERVLSSTKPGGETNVAFTTNLRTFGVLQVMK